MEEQKLTHWKKYYNPDYLGAYSIENGNDIIATIDTVARENVKGEGGREEECTVVYFKEKHIKKMIFNRTNCKTVTKIYDTPYVEEWSGKKIQIFKTETKVKGEKTECLRIRPFIPEIKLPELTPVHQKWQGAIDSIREGRNTIQGVQKYFTLSKENAMLLEEAVRNAEG